MPAHRHSHIVTAGYLRAWATDGVLSVGWADGRQSRELSPKVVGVRSGFYRERFPDGSTSDWLDPAMGKLENSALRVIRRIEDRWPLVGQDRGRVSEFVALQFVRSPAWRAWYIDALGHADKNVRRAQPDRSERSRREALERLTSDHERHQTMIGLLSGLGTIVANMHWTLLRCGASRLATSDHPLVPVPISAHRVAPLSPVPPGGVLNTYEIRLALSPRLLLLITWLDDFEPEPITKMSIDQVRNHNSTVIAQAERQWFHVPGQHAERVAGPWPPMAFTLYGLGTDPRGHRWQHVAHAIDEMEAGEQPEIDIRLIEWGVPRPSAT